MDFLVHATRFDVKAHIWWKGDSVCEKFRLGPLSTGGRRLSESLNGRMLCKVCAKNAKKVSRIV